MWSYGCASGEDGMWVKAHLTLCKSGFNPALTKTPQTGGMSNYRRLHVPGGTYFFHLRLRDHRATTLTDNIDILRMAIRLTMTRWPFEIVDAVVLPNQMMVILRLPAGDADFSKRWRLIKSVFSRHVDGPDTLPASYARRGEKGIWQRRFWEHVIRDDADYRWHRSHVLLAPVREGLVSRPELWRFSSVHRDGVVVPARGAVAVEA